MMQIRRNFHKLGLITVAAFCLGGLNVQASAASAADLDTDSAQALQTLYRKNSAAEGIGKEARAILVFPKVIKAGLIFGGSYGEGVLMEHSKVISYYNTVSGSWGWQAGAESYAYVVFLMNEKAVQYLSRSEGWEIGVGPSVVVADEGVAKNLSSSTLRKDAYAFILDQQGLMVNLSIEGTKISRIKKP